MGIRFNASRVVAILVAGLCGISWAEKTDQTVVSQFSTLLEGKFARIVWMKGGGNTSDNVWNNMEVPAENITTSIYVCDTKDGIRRPLSTKLPVGHLTNPAITADGKTVVFCVGGAAEIWISDFEGTNPHKIASPYISFKTWRNPADNSDWIVALSQADGSAYRININDPTKKTLLYNLVPDGNLCYAGLSKDGTYLIGAFPEYGNLGISKVPSGAINKSIFNPNGCWANFSKVTEGKILYTIDPHVEIKEMDITGKLILKKNIFSNGAPGPAYNALRWTNDDDYISYWPYNDPVGGSSKMPVVLRVSSLAWASLYDNATDFNGNSDVHIYSGSITNISTPLTIYRAIDKKNHGIPMFFSINGALNTGKSHMLRIDAAESSSPRLKLFVETN
jgi:hypothetical protein